MSTRLAVSTEHPGFPAGSIALTAHLLQVGVPGFHLGVDLVVGGGEVEDDRVQQ